MKTKVTSAVNRRAPHLGARGKAGFGLDVFIESQYIPRRGRVIGVVLLMGACGFYGARHVRGDSGSQFGMRPLQSRSSACPCVRGARVPMPHTKKVLRIVSAFGWGAM